MFPIGHIAYTYGAINILQRRIPTRTEVDYRWLAVVSMLPDIIDKPLALTLFRESQTSQGLAHTLLAHAIVAAIALSLWQNRSLPYLLAFSGHLALDQIWRHPATLFFPFMGWQFDPYTFMGAPGAMVSVYWEIFLLPQIWIVEVVGLFILIVFAVYHQLYSWPNLIHFLTSGQVGGVYRQACAPEPDGGEGEPGACVIGGASSAEVRRGKPARGQGPP